MREWARSITPLGEIGIVVGLALGFFLLGNVQMLVAVLAGAGLPDTHGAFDAAVLRDQVAFELTVLVLLGCFLHLRGWTPRQLGIAFREADLLWGPALVAACLGAVWVTHSLATGAYVAFAPALSAAPDALLIAALSLVNPVFEEAVLCGYLITRLSELTSLRVAANVSLAIRLTCHLYQGQDAILSILPIGILFTLWFVKTRRLVPLIVAHAIMDAWALSELASASARAE